MIQINPSINRQDPVPKLSNIPQDTLLEVWKYLPPEDQKSFLTCSKKEILEPLQKILNIFDVFSLSSHLERAYKEGSLFVQDRSPAFWSGFISGPGTKYYFDKPMRPAHDTGQCALLLAAGTAAAVGGVCNAIGCGFIAGRINASMPIYYKTADCAIAGAIAGAAAGIVTGTVTGLVAGTVAGAVAGAVAGDAFGIIFEEPGKRFAELDVVKKTTSALGGTVLATKIAAKWLFRYGIQSPVRNGINRLIGNRVEQ